MTQKSDSISVQNISVFFKDRRILYDNTISLCKNDFCAIVGPNGGGKTTFIKVLLGVIPITSGTISLLGLNPSQVCKKGIVGYVPQFSTIDPFFPASVLDVVLMGLLIKKGLFKFFSKADKQCALHALDMVHMGAFKDRSFSSLSGGERQKVFIARAIINNPELLFLDEPTSNLDPKAKYDIFSLLCELNRNTTIVLVTHDISIIGEKIDVVACINQEMRVHRTSDRIAHALASVYHCPVEAIIHSLDI